MCVTIEKNAIPQTAPSSVTNDEREIELSVESRRFISLCAFSTTFSNEDKKKGKEEKARSN